MSSAPSTCQTCSVTGWPGIWIATILLLAGCAALPDRNPLPEDYADQASVLGMSHVRYWGDEEFPIGRDLPDDPTREQVKAILPGLFGKELRILAISGGGQNGAFAAGILNGWTASGTRPEFNVVTGISTGALIAPLAYLGPDYDHIIERLYTQYSMADLVEKRSWIQMLRTDARHDSQGLRALIAEVFDEQTMEAIAAEYRRGRLLFVGTTNLDAARAVNWDIGAIANSGKPGALALIHDVLLASASIPVAFPPVLIGVEANGETYDEMHVDGGVKRQSFVFDLSSEDETFKNLEIKGQGRAYLIRNSQLRPNWRSVERTVFSIGERSASSMVTSQGIGDLYREYLGAQKFGIDFNLVYIPGDFGTGMQTSDDYEFMRALYDYGYKMAVDGVSWKKMPPGLEGR